MNQKQFGFHKHGRRNSYPRQVILQFLTKHKNQHFSAKKIYESLLQQGIYIGIASVYRNLEFLSNLDLIKKYNFDNGELKYQINDQKSEHHHVVCSNRIIDFTLDDFIKQDIGKLQKNLEKKYNIKITNYELKFFTNDKD